MTLTANDSMKRELRMSGARWRAHLLNCGACFRENLRRPGPALYCSDGQQLHRQKQRAEQLLAAIDKS